MNWEAVTALASALSALVLAATVLFAARQLRASSSQIELSRKSTQLDAMIRLFALWDSEEVMAAVQYTYCELDEKINDPRFPELLKTGHQREQPWRPALGLMERIGVYVKFGYLDATPFFYNYANVVYQLWKHLRPVVEMQRRILDNPYLWKDTEWLAGEALTYMRKLVAENPRPRPSTGETFKTEFLIEPDAEPPRSAQSKSIL